MLLQESGRLLGELTKACVEKQKIRILNSDDVYNIGLLFIRILTQCRHRVSKPLILFITEVSSKYCNGSATVYWIYYHLLKSTGQLNKKTEMKS